MNFKKIADTSFDQFLINNIYFHLFGYTHLTANSNHDIVYIFTAFTWNFVKIQAD